ncbi:D-alanyl-D-alanine carboxypeptidase DacF [Nymphon striatum]|nr:D-alanyl-D-alanine carboxypeptidase DacF [Nymphon striatum]
MKKLLIAPLLVLSACASPLETCKQEAVKDLRIVQALIADTQATIDRGYAIQTETRTVIYTNFCIGTGIGHDGRFSFCNYPQPVTTKTPVAVDLAQEKRKLRSLKQKEAELKRESLLRQQRCELEHFNDTSKLHETKLFSDCCLCARRVSKVDNRLTKIKMGMQRHSRGKNGQTSWFYSALDWLFLWYQHGLGHLTLLPTQAMVLDARTGEVLHSRNADTRLHPASLTKMMTLYVVFDAIRRGEITLETKVKISRKAAAEQPSKLGLKSGQRIALRYLIRGASVKSANDAATALGEAISGSEAAFARRMNAMAKALGMTNTTFKNAHGLDRKRTHVDRPRYDHIGPSPHL